VTQRTTLVLALVLAAVAAPGALWTARAGAQQPAGSEWNFLVSGDARNCGDVVMPGIAATAARRQAVFYWHLGDLRWITNFDEDMQHQREHVTKPMGVTDYLALAWPDFIESQIVPFGEIPFLVGIGNHEVVPPKTREEFVPQFADWLDTPTLRGQRLKDDPQDHRLKTYYHWIDRGISFYFLDNASNEQFDATQVRWFERVLTKDSADASITTIVVGMHKPLPDGYNADHSMNESATSAESGRRVYADLLKARNVAHKHVYVLASHQHFYMEDAYDTPYWKDHGGVLPGYVVGTAGAVRYNLPRPSPKVAITNVYGALVATVRPGGEIRFEFEQLRESDVPPATTARYGQDFVHWCFVNNTQVAP
jgi:hypothetical protein